MELIRLYFEMLKDASVPAHRIVRKTAALTVAGIVFLIFYRHVSLGFDLGKQMLVTLGLAFMLFAVVGIFGGVLAGGFYDSFLRGVGAQKKQLTLSVFFGEWLFAVTAPLLGLLVLGVAGQNPW